MKQKRDHRRGYPIAVFVGVEDNHAVLWQVFTHIVKLHLRVDLEGRRTDERALYNFHESVVDALKPALKGSVRSIVIIAPMKTTYTTDFLGHVRKHHAYLLQSKGSNRAVFAKLVGSADELHKVTGIVKTKELRTLIAETTSKEADHIIDALEKRLSNLDKSSAVLYSLDEIESIVCAHKGYDDFGTKHLMLTDKYLAGYKDKNRLHRLLQIAENRKVKTRVINAKTLAGKRVGQLGGIVFFRSPTK